MTSAKPGDALYDSNSALAQFIGYIAAQTDKESKRMNYLTSLLQEQWTMPDRGQALQGKIGSAFSIPLAPSATASEAIGEMNRRAQLDAQVYSQNTGKTYLAPQSQLDKAA